MADRPKLSREDAAATLRNFIRTHFSGYGQADCRNELAMLAVVDVLAAPPDPAPIPVRLTCPECGELHVDAGEFATKPHHTHACQACGMVWRPAVVPTVGVQYLPGFKDGVK